MAQQARVEVSFPLKGDWMKVQKQLEAIAKKHKGACGDSGAGFGMRDMEFYFDAYKQAVACEKKEMKVLKIEGVEFI